MKRNFAFLFCIIFMASGCSPLPTHLPPTDVELVNLINAFHSLGEIGYYLKNNGWDVYYVDPGVVARKDFNSTGSLVCDRLILKIKQSDHGFLVEVNRKFVGP